MTQQWQTAALFDGSHTGGIYRVVGPVTDVLEALQEAGWHAAHLRAGDTKEEFLVNIGKALKFPSYYGQNLDALWDCLTDLTEPTAVVWTSWHELAIDHPHDWADIFSLLNDRVAEEPAFAIVLG